MSCSAHHDLRPDGIMLRCVMCGMRRRPRTAHIALGALAWMWIAIAVIGVLWRLR